MACRDTSKMRDRFETYLTNKVAELSRRLGCYLEIRSYDLGSAMPYLTKCRVVESVLDAPNTSLVCVHAPTLPLRVSKPSLSRAPRLLLCAGVATLAVPYDFASPLLSRICGID